MPFTRGDPPVLPLAYRDKLEKRVTYPRETKVVLLVPGAMRPPLPWLAGCFAQVHEFFRPGRETCLKALVSLGDRSRVYEFYPGARDDGMVRREEIFGVKVTGTLPARSSPLGTALICTCTER